MGETPIEAEELLTSEPLLAHFATCANGRPHVAPLWYVYDDEIVEIVTSGQKLANVRENPYVSLSVEKSNSGMPNWTVTLRGTAIVVDDEAEFDAANERINQKYDVNDDSWSDNTLVRIEVGSASYQTY